MKALSIQQPWAGLIADGCKDIENQLITDIHRTMKALSIQQPWAWLIAHGYKDIENRNWKYKPSYRGQLLIHASRRFDFEGYLWVRENFPWIKIPGHEYGHPQGVGELFDSGGFVGLCRMNDVVEIDDSKWFFGPLGFKLRMAKPIKFIKFPGQLGLFDVPTSIIKQITPIT